MMRKLISIACTLVAAWTWTQAAQAQVNPAGTYYGQANQLGSATFNDTYRSGPSGAPIGIGQTGLPATSNTGRTPGANLDLINGSISMGATMGPNVAPGASLSPGLVPGVSLGSGTGLSALGPATGNITFAKPAAGSTTEPAAQPAKSPGLVAVLAGRSHDPLYIKAAEKFNNAEYKECIELLKPDAQGHRPGLESRQLYIAALVSMSRVYSAAYEAKLAAQAFPKTFFTDEGLVELYKENPDFTAHFGSVEAMCKSSTNPEMGILWALYQRLEGSEKNDPALTLSLLDVRASDQHWFDVLKDGLKKTPTPK